jgi:hypothetical protein
VATTTSANFSNIGSVAFFAGASAGAGGAIAGGLGTSVTLSTQTQPISGGAGGGGAGSSSNNGGQQTGFGDVPTISGGTVTVPNGENGFFRLKPFYSTGAGGGYGNNTGTGGNGGDGAYVCGGGGGGAGTTGGSGGRGGDGLVIISCW